MEVTAYVPTMVVMGLSCGQKIQGRSPEMIIEVFRLLHPLAFWAEGKKREEKQHFQTEFLASHS